MPELITTFNAMRMGQVKRWHIVNVAHDQSVADHSFLVTVIGLRLYEIMIGIDDKAEAFDLTCALMFHDAPEVIFGDAPTPSKARIQTIVGDNNLFDRVEASIMPKLPFSGKPHPIPEPLHRFVKMADAIETAYWIRHNSVGPYSEGIAGLKWEEMAELARRYEYADPNAGWLEAVDDVVREINLGALI